MIARLWDILRFTSYDIFRIEIKGVKLHFRNEEITELLWISTESC